jgi:hypothetical protein
VEPAATVVVMAAAVEEIPKPNILTVSLFVRESAGSGFPDFKAGPFDQSIHQNMPRVFYFF